MSLLVFQRWFCHVYPFLCDPLFQELFSRLTPDAADPRKSSSSWHGFAWFFRDFLRMLFAAGVAWFLLVSRGKKSEALFLLRACLGRTRRLAQHHAEMLRDAEMLGGIMNDSCDSYHAKRGQVRARPKKPATTHLGEKSGCRACLFGGPSIEKKAPFASPASRASSCTCPG